MERQWPCHSNTFWEGSAAHSFVQYGFCMQAQWVVSTSWCYGKILSWEYVKGVSCLHSCVWFSWTGILSNGQCWRGIQNGGIEVPSLLFDVLLSPSEVDPKHALERFTVECVAAGVKIRGHGSSSSFSFCWYELRVCLFVQDGNFSCIYS